MIPGNPAKFFAAGRKTRRTQKIGTLDQDCLSPAGVERQGDDRGLGVCRRAVAMILTHGEHAAARQIEFEIGIAAAFRRFDPGRPRLASMTQTVPLARSLKTTTPAATA